MPHTLLITGGTSGLGLAAAKYISTTSATATSPSSRDVRIIVASRKPPPSPSNANNKNNNSLPPNVEFKALDLSSLSNVRDFVDSWTAGPVSALLLNAGLQFNNLTYTPDGIESTFAVNHVGHALLFFLFASRGLLEDGCRIVITASGVHDPAQKTGMPEARYVGGEECARPMDKEYLGNHQRRYATSKLCNVLWMYALSRRLAKGEKGWTVTAMDPGLMPGTGLARDYNPVLRFVFENVLPWFIPIIRFAVPNTNTVAESGRNLGRLGVDGQFERVNGRYFEGIKDIKSSDVSNEVDKQEELWTWTIDHIAANRKEKELFEAL